MAQWILNVPDKTDQLVREHLARTNGLEGDLSEFVDQAVRQKIFRQTVREIKEKNADLDPDYLMDLIDEAVDWARANPS